MPIAAISAAMAMNTRNDAVIVASSRALASSSSHTRASPPAPGEAISAAAAASDTTTSMASITIAPSRWTPWSWSHSTTSFAASRATSHSTMSPAGWPSSPAPRTMCTTPGVATSWSMIASVRSGGTISRRCNTAPSSLVEGGIRSACARQRCAGGHWLPSAPPADADGGGDRCSIRTGSST